MLLSTEMKSRSVDMVVMVVAVAVVAPERNPLEQFRIGFIGICEISYMVEGVFDMLGWLREHKVGVAGRLSL